MTIHYEEKKEFTEEALGALFGAVGWASGKYPKRLVAAMRNSSRVLSAWDGDRLVGLARSLDDGATTAFLHYLLVHPAYQKYHIGGTLLSKMLEFYQEYLYVKIMPSDQALIPFYEKYGFRMYDRYCAMEIDRLDAAVDALPGKGLR